MSSIKQKIDKLNAGLRRDRAASSSAPKGRRMQSRGGYQSTGVSKNAVRAGAAAAEIAEYWDEKD
jgi:hypothetical protein